MLFNHRRLSQDKVIPLKLSDLAGNGKIYLNEYSSKLFDKKDNLIISENFINEAGEEDICFIENSGIPINKASELYIFKWNRDYPADTFFTCNIKDLGFKKIDTEDLTGTSHKKITLEIYRRSEL